MSQLGSGTGSGSFAPFSGRAGVPLSSTSPFPIAHVVPEGESGHSGYEDTGTYADLDFVAPKGGFKPDGRTIFFIGLLVIVVIGAVLYFTVFKSNNSSTPITQSPPTVVTTTTVPLALASAQPYKAADFSAKFPTPPTVSQTKTTVALPFASTTYQSTVTLGSASYTYEVIEVPSLPVQMTPQGGATGGGKLTMESIVQSQEPSGDNNTLKTATPGTAGPNGGWLTAAFVIQTQSSPAQFLVGKAFLIGTDAFIVEVQGPSDRLPGETYFVNQFQPSSTATATAAPSGSGG